MISMSVTDSHVKTAVGALGKLLKLLDPDTRRSEMATEEGPAYWFEVPSRGFLALSRSLEDGFWESEATLGMGLNGWRNATLEGLAEMLSALVMGHITTVYHAASAIMTTWPT